MSACPPDCTCRQHTVPNTTATLEPVTMAAGQADNTASRGRVLRALNRHQRLARKSKAGGPRRRG